MLTNALKKVLGPGSVVTDAHELGAFTEDWRGRYRGSALCVALPSDTAQVAAVV